MEQINNTFFSQFPEESIKIDEVCRILCKDENVVDSLNSLDNVLLEIDEQMQHKNELRIFMSHEKGTVGLIGDIILNSWEYYCEIHYISSKKPFSFKFFENINNIHYYSSWKEFTTKNETSGYNNNHPFKRSLVIMEGIPVDATSQLDKINVIKFIGARNTTYDLIFTTANIDTALKLKGCFNRIVVVPKLMNEISI